MTIKSMERVVETKIKDNDLVRRRRDEIIRAAGKVFVKKGYHLATIRDICEELSLGPGTIYNYVKSKEDILYLVYDKLTTMLTEALLETTNKNISAMEQLTEVLKKTIDIVWDYQDLILLMYQETAALNKESLHNILKRESDYVLQVEHILEEARDNQAIQIRNVKLAANIIVYLLAFFPQRRWNLKNGFKGKQIKSGLIDFIFGALANTK